MATAAMAGTMIDRRQRTARLPGAVMRPGIPTHGEDRSAQRPVRSGEAHPLLAAFPLTVMALATFMVLFALMMARLKAGAEPALHPSTSAVVSFVGSSRSSVVTRTSGIRASGATTVPATAPEHPAATRSVIVTRASGTLAARSPGDD